MSGWMYQVLELGQLSLGIGLDWVDIRLLGSLEPQEDLMSPPLVEPWEDGSGLVWDWMWMGGRTGQE